MTTLGQMKETFRLAEAVCFDVDSTVIREEGIDELAKFCGVGDAVTEMWVSNTRKTLSGEKGDISEVIMDVNEAFTCVMDREMNGHLSMVLSV